MTLVERTQAQAFVLPWSAFQSAEWGVGKGKSMEEKECACPLWQAFFFLACLVTQ